MTLKNNISQEWFETDLSSISKMLTLQLEKHFSVLVSSVPSIESIEWKSEQEDEMDFNLTFFKVIKKNHHFILVNYHDINLESTEFSKDEIQSIIEFKDYLNKLSRIIVIIFGNGQFSLENDFLFGEGSEFRLEYCIFPSSLIIFNSFNFSILSFS